MQGVIDPDGDMNAKDLLKSIKKSLKKFAKDFGKMELMEKIELIIEQMSGSNKPLDQGTGSRIFIQFFQIYKRKICKTSV